MGETDIIETQAVNPVETALDEKLHADAVWEGYQRGEAERQSKSIAAAVCPKCGSIQGQWRGYRTRKTQPVAHRRWCKACGKWFQTAR